MTIPTVLEQGEQGVGELHHGLDTYGEACTPLDVEEGEEGENEEADEEAKEAAYIQLDEEEEVQEEDAEKEEAGEGATGVAATSLDEEGEEEDADEYDVSPQDEEGLERKDKWQRLVYAIDSE